MHTLTLLSNDVQIDSILASFQKQFSFTHGNLLLNKHKMLLLVQLTHTLLVARTQSLLGSVVCQVSNLTLTSWLYPRVLVSPFPSSQQLKEPQTRSNFHFLSCAPKIID